MCFIPVKSVWTLKPAKSGARDDISSSASSDERPWLLAFMTKTTIFLLDADLTTLVRE